MSLPIACSLTNSERTKARCHAEGQKCRYRIKGIGRWLGIVRLTGGGVFRQFLRHTALMRTSLSIYHRHRVPVEIISHCVWLYFRFPLSFRDVEEMLAMRGVSLSYETVREWCLKFGQTYANGLRHKAHRPGDRWHLDEVFPKDQRTTPLPLACGRSGWRGAGYFGSEAKGQEGSKEILSQVFKGFAVCPARDRHRQAEELQCCES